MKLFIPLLAEDARSVERGGGFGATAVDFVDRPVLEEADDDAVWVAVEVPEEDAERFEGRREPLLGHRQFTIPAEVASRFSAMRVVPQTPDWWGHFASLRALLLYEWDPIGVHGMAELQAIYDEYDHYLGPIADLLDRGSIDDVAEYLGETRRPPSFPPGTGSLLSATSIADCNW